MRLSVAARALGCEHSGADVEFDRVTTDTRQMQGGELFVALVGPNFDGHDFIEQAQVNGAVAVLVSWRCTMPLPALVVDDTTRALGQLAAYWRTQHDSPVIAITGSNGKTTVKQMLGSILSRIGDGLVTQANLNNHIGVPLTLLRMRPADQFAVIELGMNHAGEIAYLTRLVKPKIALINNAANAHLEGLGSVENVARAKAEIFQGLPSDGVAIINADDAFASYWCELASPVRCVTFGLDNPADVGAQIKENGLVNTVTMQTPIGEVDVRLTIPGRHNVMNALAATAAALEAGATLEQIKAGLETMAPVRGRLQSRQGVNGATVFDDTYNANPDSLYAAIRVLAGCIGRKILVLGDMAELGTGAEAMHSDAGHAARDAGIHGLFVIGELARNTVDAFGANGMCFDDYDALIDALRDAMDADTTLLVKGSRRMHMETVTDAICREHLPGQTGTDTTHEEARN